jgi:hypothetical protein
VCVEGSIEMDGERERERRRERDERGPAGAEYGELDHGERREREKGVR